MTEHTGELELMKEFLLMVAFLIGTLSQYFTDQYLRFFAFVIIIVIISMRFLVKKKILILKKIG